jgi:hypothetical protein
MQYRESADAGGSSDEERSSKRVKETHLSSNATSSELHLAFNEPHSLGQQPLEMEAESSSYLQREKPVSVNSPEETDKANTSEAATQAIFETVEGEISVPRSLFDVIPATWNQGVQSGLRTSFGGKSKRRSRRDNSHSLMGDGPGSNVDVAIPSALQEDSPTRFDQGISRGSDDENDELLVDSKSLTTNQAHPLSAQAAQIKVPNSQYFPAYRELQPCISEPQSHRDNDTREETMVTEEQADLRQPGSSSSEDDGTEGEESRHNGTAGLGGLPTASSTSERPKKFRRIAKRKLELLPVPERHAYEEALAAHTAKARENKARRALLEGTKDPRLDKAPKKLSASALELLDPQEREAYLATFEANRLERHWRAFEEVTRNATKYLANPGSVSDHSVISGQITNGFTFYPRKCKPSYQKKGVYFPLSEVLDQGKPIHVEHFSFNVFAPAFMAAHPKRRDLLSQSNLIAAFHLYITNFYSHIMQFGFADRLRATATADDALTLEQAKALADLRGPGRFITLNKSIMTSGGDQGKTSPSLLPPAEKIEHHESNSPNRVYMTANPEHSQPSSASFSTNENSDLGMNPRNIETSLLDRKHITSKDDDDEPMIDVAQTDAMDSKSLHEEVESMKFGIDEAELFLQQKYFLSGTASTTRHCLSCGHLGHNSSACPALACTSCSTFGKHSTASCPLNARCGKCRERGHSMRDCPEKLARSKGEAVPCDMCGSKDHLEIACDYIWRSYEPKPEEIRTVRDIPAHCYMCGGSDHYGPECGLHRGRILSSGNTWSRRNLQKYVDPTSQNRAISAGVDYSIPPRSNKQFSIKGKANDPIEIDDSDDNEGFIRAKINPPVQSGHIRFGRSNEQSLSGSMQNNSGNMLHQSGQPSQHGMNRPSGPPQGMHSRTIPGPPGPRGSNNGGGGKKGPNIKKKGGPPGPQAPGRRKRKPKT